MVTRLTEHDDVIKSLLRGAPRLGLALGPAPARAGPDHSNSSKALRFQHTLQYFTNVSLIARFNSNRIEKETHYPN